MNMIFDSHAHYDSEQFNNDREELLKTLPSSGICGAINCASDIKTSEFSIELSKKYDYIYAAVGVHPEECVDAGEYNKEVLCKLCSQPKVVAIGEIGLDYHYENIPRDVQKFWFEEQVRLSTELDLPVIVHDREAHADTMEIMRKYKPKGVIHCFSGSVEMAKEALKYGLYIGIGGSVTFKNARVPVEVAGYVPLERILLETDCPYMTPVPHRGERNDSRFIAFSAAKIAEIKHLPVEDVLSAGVENAHRLFNIK